MIASAEPRRSDTEALTRPSEDLVQHASDITGSWGPLQRNLVTFYVLLYLISAFQNVGVTFYTPTIEFWCKKPRGYENATLKKCKSYEDDSLPCQQWEYDKTFYQSTFIDEFNLVCDREWIASMTASIYQIGNAFSCIFVGFTSDKCGRIVALKVSIILEIIAGLWQSLAINVKNILISRFLLGIASYGRFLTGQVLIIEAVGPEYRDVVRIAIEFGWCVGYLIMPWINYFVPNFRDMQLILATYECLFLIWLFKLPESARWQLSYGQFAEAESTIREAALSKGHISEEKIEEMLVQLRSHVDKEKLMRENEMKKTILDVWRVPALRRHCLALYFVWFASVFVFYSLSYNAEAIGGSLHVNVFVQGIAQSAVIILLLLTIDHVPRKRLATILLILGVVATCAIIPFTFVNWGVPYMVTLSIVVKFCVSGVMHLMYLISAEIFPTTLRQVGVGSCSIFGRVGSTLAPFVKELSQVTHLSVMMATMAALSFFEWVAIQFLPETKGLEIPDTIEEAKQLFGGNKGKVMSEAKTMDVSRLAVRTR